MLNVSDSPTQFRLLNPLLEKKFEENEALVIVLIYILAFQQRMTKFLYFSFILFDFMCIS